MYIQGKQWVASESASNWLRFGSTEEKDVPCLFRIYIQYVFAYKIILRGDMVVQTDFFSLSNQDFAFRVI